jgi:glucose-1-phosphate adenylyltransferase
MDFKEMIDSHAASGAEISIATIPVGDRSSEFGILKADKNNVINKFAKGGRITT